MIVFTNFHTAHCTQHIAHGAYKLRKSTPHKNETHLEYKGVPPNAHDAALFSRRFLFLSLLLLLLLSLLLLCPMASLLAPLLLFPSPPLFVLLLLSSSPLWVLLTLPPRAATLDSPLTHASASFLSTLRSASWVSSLVCLLPALLPASAAPLLLFLLLPPTPARPLLPLLLLLRLLLPLPLPLPKPLPKRENRDSPKSPTLRILHVSWVHVCIGGGARVERGVRTLLAFVVAVDVTSRQTPSGCVA